MLRVNPLTQRETKAVNVYKALLLKAFPGRIQNFLLFGSKARRTAGRWSDIDLLVVLTKNGRKARKEIAALTHEPIAKYGVELSPVVVTASEMKEWSPFIAHIKKEAIPI